MVSPVQLRRINSVRGRGSIAVLLAILLAAAPAAPESDDAPISFWTFDDSLTDSRGKSEDNLATRGGQQSGLRFVSAGELPGTVGKAMALGVEPRDVQYLCAPTSADVKLGASYTIEAWIYPTHLSVWNRLVLNWAGEHAYHLAIHHGLLSLYHGQANGQYVFAEGGRVQTGRWYHVAGVARRNDAEPTGSSLEVYLNGRLVATTGFDGTIRTLGREGLGVGDSAGGTGARIRYRGYLDELAIWDRALGAGAILAHYNKRAEVLREIEPITDVPEVLDFPRDIQPILSRHCVKCHNHKDRKGGGVLAGDRGPVFSHSYYTLLQHWQVKDTASAPTDGSGRQKGNDKPYTTYSSASPLMRKTDGGHNELKLDEIKRFDMPGFRPNEHYVREMKRFGILPKSFDMAKEPINVYETDRKYWQSLWHGSKTLADAAHN